VTGCAGFIGSHLTEALLADGSEVVGVDCFNDNYGRREKLHNLETAREWDGFDFVPVDLSRGELGDLVAECDAVYHLAAEPGVRSSWGLRFDQYLRNNVLATQLLLEAMRDNPGTRFVYASSSSIYGEAEALPTPRSGTGCGRSSTGSSRPSSP
jgi:UDP-glucuronate 4-epimerase